MVEVDAPERVEEQSQTADGNAPTAEDSKEPIQDGDKPERDGEDNPDKTNEPPKKPSGPPDPPDPDEDRDPDDPDQDQEKEEEEKEEDEEEADQEGEEEEKETGEELGEVVSASTRKKKKEAERKEKVKEAGIMRLPYGLPEEGPSYKGVISPPKEEFKHKGPWGCARGVHPLSSDASPIDLRENRAFENIRLHQINSIFSLQKHLVDCNKGGLERNSTPAPLRGLTGEYVPCETEMTTVQSSDGTWVYEYSELPGLVRMKHGLKSFDIIEQIPFSQPPKGPHRNLV